MAWCLECHQECDVITVDNGIGAYEYWGFPGVDRQLCEVSDCCVAAFTEHEYELEQLDENGNSLDEETICNRHRLSFGLLPTDEEENPCEAVCAFDCPVK